MNESTNRRLSKLALNPELDTACYDVIHVSKYGKTLTRHYLWTNKCDNLYSIDTDLLWEQVFPILNPIDFQVTKNVTDVKKFYRATKSYMRPFKMIDQVDFIDIPTWNQTGYVIPNYSFLKHKLSDDIVPSFEVKKSYDETIDLFGLNEDSKISASRYNEIGNYRDILHTQIERQANLIQKILPKIANILKIHYFESEKAIAMAKTDASSDEKVLQLENDWYHISRGLSFLFKNSIQSGMNLNDIRDKIKRERERHNFDVEVNGHDYVHYDLYPFQIDKNKYIKNEIMERTLNGYEDYVNQIENIVDTALLIVKKIAPIESILEDFFLNREISSSKEFVEKNKKQNRPYGTHSQNDEWIKKTFEKELKSSPSQRQACIKTQDLYKEKFGLKISESHIYRLCNIH